MSSKLTRCEFMISKVNKVCNPVKYIFYSIWRNTYPLCLAEQLPRIFHKYTYIQNYVYLLLNIEPVQIFLKQLEYLYCLSQGTYLVLFFCIFQTEGLILIPENDWKLFCEEWNAVEDKGIQAEISFNNNSTSKVTGSSEDLPTVYEDLDHCNEDTNNELENRRPFIRTCPEVNLPLTIPYLRKKINCVFICCPADVHQCKLGYLLCFLENGELFDGTTSI